MGFLVSEDLITAKVDYIELGPNHVLIIGNDEYKEICNKKKIEVKTIKAKFARASWGKFNQYIKGTVFDDVIEGTSKMDTVLLRQQKFRVLLEEISQMIDGEFVDIPLTYDLFEKINSDIAIALITKYDDELNRERGEAAKILGLFDELEEDNTEGDKSENKTEEKENSPGGGSEVKGDE